MRVSGGPITRKTTASARTSSTKPGICSCAEVIEVRLLIAAMLVLLGAGLPHASGIAGQAVDRIDVQARSRSVQPGELVVLTIAPSSRVERVRLRAFDRDVAAFTAPAPSGEPRWQALVGIDLDVKPGTYPVAIDADEGRLRATYDLVVAPKHFPTRRLTVNESFVNPPPSERERIEREAKLLENVWVSPAPERLWTAPFVRPVAEPANSR